MKQISVIIPVLNEAENLRTLLPFLLADKRSESLREILVVDGGSTDGSLEIAREYGARTIRTEAGRARQMNAGADAATGEILYFLHADSLPPEGFDRAIRRACAQEPVAGCFRLCFDSNSRTLACFAWFTRLNWPLCRGGDQSLFIPASWFRSLGGFDPAYTIYEDNEFTGRIYRRYPFRVLPLPIRTSARKYKAIGVWKLQFHFGIIHLLYFAGAGPRRLSRYYQRHIAGALGDRGNP